MYCKNCGKEISDNAISCPNCGAMQQAQQTAQPQNVQPQPNGYAQQVIFVQQQQQQQPLAATPAEKEALFSTAGSLWMLIACIVATVNLVVALVNNPLSGIISTILNLLIVIGMWIVFAKGRSKNLSTTSVSLIRVPYIILFVFSVLSFIGNIFIWIFRFDIFAMLIGIVAFVLNCICYSSVMKSLNIARRINNNRSAMGMKPGVFAGVIMIITAAFTFIQIIYNYFRVRALIGLAGSVAGSVADEEATKFVIQLMSTLLGGGNIFTIIAGGVAFIASISAAIVLLKFAKKFDSIDA